MSELSKKYNIPETAVKAMIKDGWLSCSVPQYEEVYNYYVQMLNQNGGRKMDAVYKTASHSGLSENWVYKIVERFT
jgi:Mor family transcriptional regulator